MHPNFCLESNTNRPGQLELQKSFCMLTQRLLIMGKTHARMRACTPILFYIVIQHPPIRHMHTHARTQNVQFYFTLNTQICAHVHTLNFFLTSNTRTCTHTLDFTTHTYMHKLFYMKIHNTNMLFNIKILTHTHTHIYVSFIVEVFKVEPTRLHRSINSFCFKNSGTTVELHVSYRKMCFVPLKCVLSETFVFSIYDK